MKLTASIVGLFLLSAPFTATGQTTADPVPLCYAEKDMDLSDFSAEYARLFDGSIPHELEIPTEVHLKLDLDDHDVPTIFTTDEDASHQGLAVLAKLVAESSPIKCTDGRPPREVFDRMQFKLVNTKDASFEKPARELIVVRNIRPYADRNAPAERLVQCRTRKDDEWQIDPNDCSYVGSCKFERGPSVEPPDIRFTKAWHGEIDFIADLSGEGRVLDLRPIRFAGSPKFLKATRRVAKMSRFTCMGPNPLRQSRLGYSLTMLKQ